MGGLAESWALLGSVCVDCIYLDGFIVCFSILSGLLWETDGRLLVSLPAQASCPS